MKKNEPVDSFSSEDYLFGTAIRNFPVSCGNFSQNLEEIRRFITALGLTIRPDACFVERDRRCLVASVWRFRRDYEAFYRVGEKGYALRGRFSIPRSVSNCSLDYQLSLFD